MANFNGSLAMTENLSTSWLSIFTKKAILVVKYTKEMFLTPNPLLYYVSLTNKRQGVKQDTRVQLQVMNNLIKLKFI